jgi:hypothetical protein
MGENSGENPADPRVLQAIRTVQQSRVGQPWMQAEQRNSIAAVYQELCRLDTGCQRTGLPSDRQLPLCRGNAVFRARRGCIVD